MTLSEKLVPPPLVTAAFAVMLGVGMDALVRFVQQDMDLLTLVFWRFGLATVLVAVPYFLTGRRLPGWKATRFHALRGLVHVAAATLFFFALSKLELVVVTALGFSAVLIITPFAWLLLGERPAKFAVLAGLTGFIGVLVTFLGKDMNFRFTPDEWLGFASVMTSAVCYALSMVMLRMRATKDSGFAIAIYANFFPAIYMAVPAFLFAEPATFSDFPLLVLLGAFGGSSWVLMTSAYARAPAQKIAPIEYTALIWSALLGWMFYEEVPTIWVWIGAAIIIAACVLVSREPRLKPAPTEAAHS